MKTAAKKHTRRLISASLIFAMLTGIVPMPARAAGESVTYNRADPEVGILNAVNGMDDKFYRAIKGPTSGADASELSFYNAVKLYGADYSTRATGDTEWTWDTGKAGEFGDSTLKQLLQSYNNIQSNISGTFYNRKHTHTKKKSAFKDYVNEVTSYETANFMVGGCYTNSVGGFANIMAKTPRVGDGSENYQSLTYFKNDGGRIKFASPSIAYINNELRYCTCGGTYAENVVLTFRDIRAPQIDNIEYSTDGTKWTSKYSRETRVKKGDTIYIRLTCTEPIRFADDSAAGKENLYLSLCSDGVDGADAPRAMLRSLEGKSLVFSYEFRGNNTLDLTRLDTSSLFPSKETGLVQLKGKVNGGGSTPISGYSGDGYTTAKSYITDLAGNALVKKDISNPRLTLDGEAPYVARVDYTLGMNNADVKEAQGKPQTKPESNDGKDDWTDASDLYLGAGDTVQLKIEMNEELAVKTSGNIITYRDIVATTNLMKNGAPVRTTSSITYAGTGDNKRTTFVMDTIVITDDMTMSGSDGVKVTKLEWASGANTDVTDLAGNAFDPGAVKPDANKNPPMVDLSAPYIRAGENPYTPGENNSFTYHFIVKDINMEDKGASSGETGIFGTFTLNNKGDGKNYRYEWAVTAAADSTASEWQTGTTGEAQRFIQNKENYLHVRPLDGEEYGDLSGCTITVEAKDFAGNKGKMTLPSADGTIPWYVDNLAPTARANGSTRKLNGSDGELSVYVIMNDTHGISAWQYAWGDDDKSAPTDDSAWTNGALTATDSGSASATLTETVTGGTNFAKYLWVKVTDNAREKNESDAICLGQYSYNLAKVAYQLDYSTAIASEAHIAVNELPENDTLVFMVKVPSEYADDNKHYAVLALTNSHDKNYSGPQDDEWVNCDRNIFDIDKPSSSSANYTLANNAWYYMTAERTLDESKNVKYTFKADPSYVQDENGLPRQFNNYSNSLSLPGKVEDWWQRIGLGTESGTLDVTVLSGTWGSVERWQMPKTDPDTGETTSTAPSYFFYAPIVAGTSSQPIAEEHFQLRMAGDNWGNNFGDLTIKRISESELPTSVGQVTYEVSINGDKNGWNYENIDWNNSDVSIMWSGTVSNGHDVWSKYKDFKLGPFRVDENDKATQRFTVPIVEYWDRSGKYSVMVTVRTFTGGNAELFMGKSDYFYVDNTEPTNSLSLSSIDYDPGFSFQSTTSDATHNAYDLVNSYGTRTVGEQDGRFIVPAGMRTNISAGEKYTLKVGVEDGKAPDVYGTGKFDVQMWNITNPNSKITLEGNESQTEFTLERAKLDTLNLKTNEDNTIAMQKIYKNGRTSGVQYAVIHPASDAVDGTAKVDSAGRKLIFTPSDTAQQPASVFAWAYSDTQDYSFAEGERIDMKLQSDGTWTCDLTDEGANYHIITESANGAVCVAAAAYERAPRFADGIKITGNADGTYSMAFEIRDDYETIQENGMDVDIDVSFAKGDTAVSTGSYHFKADETNFDHDWTAESAQETGFLEVHAKGTGYHNEFSGQNSYDYLIADITGVYLAGSDTMTVTVTATDAAGYTGTSTVTVAASPVSPEPLTDEANKPYFTADGLGVKFNQPVRPAESWAWKEKDGTGYSTDWAGAFPVPGNGTHTIFYTDIFGNEYTEQITTDAFTENGIDRSIEFSLSATEPTDKDVALTTNAQQGVIKVWEINGLSSTTLPDANGVHYAKRRTTTLDHNAELSVRSYSDETGESGSEVLRLRVYIDNVAKGAPEAEVRYYIAAYGEEFTASELEELLNRYGGKLSVLGNVRATYETSRHVTPAGGTQSEHLFTPTDRAAYTFQYVDDLGQEGSAVAHLPDGLTLTAPQEPPEDKTAPVVSVDIYAKRGGRYESAEGFIPSVYDISADIAAKFAEVGYVQGYNLTVNASDESGFDITMTSDNGATISGNVITVTKGGTVNVTVTDKSKYANKVEFTVTIPDGLIDNEKPTATVTSVYTTVYTKNLYIKLQDNTDGDVTLDAPAGLSIVTDAEGAADGPDKGHAGEYRYPAIANGTVNFVFHDEAGNRETAGAEVVGLDTDPPKLSVRWSPPLITQDANGQTTRDETHPTADTVNTSITATIESSKPMKTLKMKIGQDTEGHPAPEVSLIENGAAVNQPYEIKGQGEKVLVSVTAAPTRIVVTFRDQYSQNFLFTATAPNGKSAALTLEALGNNAIDRTAPTVTVSQTPIMREGATKPYAVEVTMTPNEDAFFMNYGMQGKTYKPGEPLTVRFTENGTYTVRVADKAGNVGNKIIDQATNTESENFTISDIDNTPPELTLSKTDNGQSSTVEITVDKACTVTWGTKGEKHEFTGAGSHTATITENGTYVFTATDAAGNERWKTVTVGAIDNMPPHITFKTNTIYLTEGAGESELDAELAEGYTAWDDNQASAVPTVAYDKRDVDLNAAGQYTVLYTVTDAAGNENFANRFVRVIGRDTVGVEMDGAFVIPDSTAVLKPGTHKLTLRGSSEPYSVKARRGILSAGQMKYMNDTSLIFSADGTFSVTETGYYTVLITTQSRETIRLLLCVER